MEDRASLKDVATTVLVHLRQAIARGTLRAPLDRAALVGFGVRHQLEAIEGALAGHKSAACLAVLDVVLAEREERRPSPELVWTGPEAQGGTARDTAVVLRELFESARETVILGGYNFKYSTRLLEPLHRSMMEHGVDVKFFMHVPQVEHGEPTERRLEEHLGGFFATEWTFSGPRPRVYYDKRALVPGPPWSSLHAKCVVVDGARAFVSSANFSHRAQENNIEVGVLVDDGSFASFLAGQWLGLIDAAIVGEYKSE
jgi:phosphatidylserine/phosphatidylglycerophosphate/cardiolipin synthase-like enzyme